MSAATRAALWAGLRRLGITDGAAARVTVGQWLTPPRELRSSNELTDAEGQQLIGRIKREEQRAAVTEETEPPIEEPPNDD
jgi:hypothetical protein